MFSRLSDSKQQKCEPKQKQPNHHIIAAVPHLLLVLAELAELLQDAACMMNSLRHQEQITINRNEICWHKSQITIFFYGRTRTKNIVRAGTNHKSQITINRNEMCWHKSQIIIFFLWKDKDNVCAGINHKSQ
jgi:hypothetical protein